MVAHDIWATLSFSRKLQLFLVFLLTISVTVMDLFSLVSAASFIGLLSGVNDKGYLFDLFKDENNTFPVLLITVLFLVFIILSALLRILLMYFTQRVAHYIGTDISLDLYERIIKRKYTEYIQTNSSSIVNTVVRNVEIIIGSGILPLLNAVVAFIILIPILGILFYMNVQATLIVFLILGGAYFLMALSIRRKAILNSKLIEDESSKLIKTIQESLGGIRDIILTGAHQIYIEEYKRADVRLRNAESINQFMTLSPKIFLEMLGMSLLIGIAAYMYFYQNDKNTLITLAVIALAAQKILPLMQQLYVSYSSISGRLQSIQSVLEILKKPLETSKIFSVNSIEFMTSIQFNAVSYHHPQSNKFIFKELNFDIRKGEIFGIKGISGVGKSTLIDLIIGLLQPINGFVSIDGCKLDEYGLSNWQRNIAHIPQNIYLSDDSLAKNIAFGSPEESINYEKIEKILRIVHLESLVNDLPLGIKTRVGERGVFLSGGQRQRLGIARALYRDASLIIFDEATSALDVETEELIMENIYREYPLTTLIIVSHRLATLNKCNRILDLRSGNQFDLLVNKQV